MKKHLHIVVEGCDAVGKTTLINELQKLTGFDVVKGSDFSIAEKGVRKMYEYMENLANRDENLIIDRDFISNLVYAPLYDKNKLSNEMIEKLINIKKHNTIVIHLTASIETIKKRIETRGDDYVKTEHLQDILDGYEIVIRQLKPKLNIFTYNVEYIELHELANLISIIADRITYND